MKKTIPGFVVAAPTSGAGKTTVARGLMAMLRRRGLRVQPFKCGPDYIDPKFHTAVCGRPSVNLDLFMASESHVRELYDRYSAGADVCVVEGMMGMFDGYDRDLGSAAHVARVLGLPVVLVVDARAAAYSLAPLLYGFTRFRKEPRVAGVIFNKVGTGRHRTMLTQVCRDLGIECLGFLPKCAAVEQPSRYLGLDFSKAAEEDELVRLMEENVIIDTLIPTPALPKGGGLICHSTFNCSASPSPQEGWAVSISSSLPSGGLGWVLGWVSGRTSAYQAPSLREGWGGCQGPGGCYIASSPDAFSFLYQEHLDILRSMGEVVLFDPADDKPLPADTALLYLPGGYPERHAEELSKAHRTLESIRSYAERGGRVLAECGGMMYLCRSIATDEGVFPMAGVLPYDITARTADRKLSLGYRRFTLNGCEMRGHEFHYSHFAGDPPQSDAQVLNAVGEPVSTAVMRRGNVIAGYTHLYWGETDIMRLFGE